MTVFEQAARRLSTLHKPVYFIQIGAMDGVTFDPIHRFIVEYGWQGVLVEPTPHHFAALTQCYRDRPGLQLANAAITDRVGTATLYTIPPEVVRNAGLPYWANGISSFSLDHIRFQQRYLDATKHPDIMAHVTGVQVETLTLAALQARYPLPELHLLQIDAEGYDYEIMRQYDFTKHKPAIVNIEIDNMGDAKTRECLSFLRGHGYSLHRHDQDLLALQPHIAAS